MNAQTRDTSAMDRFKSVLKRYSLGHASADQVREWLEDRGGIRVTVASVYNILTQMSLLGVYTHRFSSNNKMYFDVNNFKHIHLYDTVNNDFKDVMDDELLEMVESRIRSKRYRGYKVDGVDIQIICHPTVKKSTVTR